MIRISHTHGDENVVFRTEGGDFDHWAAGDLGRCDALGSLRAYVEDHPENARFETNRVVASHAAVAALGAAQARSLGLPGRPPFVFSTDTGGVIGSPRFRLIVRWLDGGSPVVSSRKGAFLETASGTFLIPEPLFSAIELADGFDGSAVELTEHWGDTQVRFGPMLSQYLSQPARCFRFWIEGVNIFAEHGAHVGTVCGSAWAGTDLVDHEVKQFLELSVLPKALVEQGDSGARHVCPIVVPPIASAVTTTHFQRQRLRVGLRV